MRKLWLIFSLLVLGAPGPAVNNDVQGRVPDLDASHFNDRISPQLGATQTRRNLAGTSWQLVKFEGGDGNILTPDDRAKYTIAFGLGGRMTARIDCNRGRGTWKSSGPNHIQFGPLALTRAKCPADSLHDQIIRNWKFVRSYVLRDGRLFLSLMADGGIYEFEPVRQSGEAGSIFGKRWRLTEIRGGSVKTTKAYLEFDGIAKQFSGDGGCNRIAGGFAIKGAHIKFSEAISTQRACTDTAQQQVETRFFNALSTVSRFEIEGNTLRLYGGIQAVLTFSSDPTANSTQERN